MKPASFLVAFSLLVAACVSSSEKHSGKDAQGVAQDLINGVSGNYDCTISLNSGGDSLELGLDTIRHSASVSMSGEQCTNAMQELQDRGREFQLSFVEIQTVELRSQSDPKRSLDLIHEIDPETEN